MSLDYSEDTLIQEGTATFLERLGWESIYAYDQEVLGQPGTLGRNTYKDVFLRQRFRKALRRINPWINEDQLAEACDAMTSHSATQTLMQTNEQKYRLIRDGIDVTDIKPNGTKGTRRAQVIDFNNPENNDFLAVRELWVYGQIYHRRADVVGFVNGLPLVFMELKNHDVAIDDAYNNNYSDYLDVIPQLFWYNAFVILSNGDEARVGTVGSKWEFFSEWKRLKESDAGNIELPTMLEGIMSKENFLDILENFILFDHSDGQTVKIMARNHQFLGVNEAVEKYRERKLCQGKLGVFWHTQGSGKSYSMLFLAQKIRRKFEGSPTIVVLTDRDELNRQISGIFESCGLLGNSKAKQFIATSGGDLIEKLKGNPSFIFSLIQKFNKPDAESLYPDHDIILMSDEAHRTQNGVFAENMLHLLPTANRIGFTGTPLMKNDNITARTFGGYVSIYDFQRAVEDHATVPLYYENRASKIKDLKNPVINEEIAAALDDADLSPDQLAKVEHEFAKEVHLLTAEKRLRLVAKDFVRHYSDLWTTGKAMVVSYNKVTCVRMYNYVQEYWQEKIEELKDQEKHSTSEQESLELKHKIKWMEETDMAVVISDEQNEQKTFQKWGLDITPHRIRMMKEPLEKNFKNAENPLRVVFVCAMWLTGFDVKTLSCLYLDKPMKAHTLMQAIARANRVAEGKTNGLIIDYIGVVKALRRALADYTVDRSELGGTDPTIDKEQLIEQIKEELAAIENYLVQYGFEIDDVIKAQGLERLSEIRRGADAMCTSSEIRKTYCFMVSRMLNHWKYLDHEDYTLDMKAKRDAMEAIYKELQKKRKHADITDLSVEINKIVNQHLEVEDTLAAEGSNIKIFNISKIDFDLLRREFDRTRQKHLMIRDILDAVRFRMEQMLADNPSRVNFYERYRNIIEEYNSEQNRANIERTFEMLLRLSESLTAEQERYLHEGFENDEQLAMFDLLMNKKDLNKSDIKKLKKVAIDLYTKIKEKLANMDHPFDKPETRAAITNVIRYVLFEELPESCYGDMADYQNQIFTYVSNRYGNAV